MNCTEALELIDLAVDGEATEEQRSMLMFHLNGCASCRRAMKMTEAISGRTGELGEPSPPEDLLEKVRARLDSGSYDQSPLKRTVIPLMSWKIAAAIPFAAAAVLLIGNLNGSGQAPAITASETGETQAAEADVYAPAPVIAYSRPSSVTTF